MVTQAIFMDYSRTLDDKKSRRERFYFSLTSVLLIPKNTTYLEKAVLFPPTHTTIPQPNDQEIQTLLQATCKKTYLHWSDKSTGNTTIVLK
jgi:hypothetical protein